MQTVFKILRRESAEAVPRWQEISFETEDESATVASALRMINESGDYVDAEGSRVKKIIWECSCLQKKCGACAMVINGRPGLACDSFLRDFRKKRGGITLEPLRKFPVIADLMVDRSILFENLKQMELWAKETVHLPEKQRETAYDASRCLQCGCCLEICPNFLPGESFFGAAGFVPAARLIASLDGEEKEKLQWAYREHIFRGCGKSLACGDICPAGIEVERLLVRSNAAAVWKKS